MKKNLRKAKGITLIVLVVTIVVILIIASVVINLTLNKNGIIKRAKDSSITYKYQANNELNEIEKAQQQIDNYNTNEEDNQYILYNNGEQKVQWNTPVPNRNGNWSSELLAIFETNDIKLYEQESYSWRNCGIVTAQQIDVTNYKKFKFTYEVIEPSKGNISGNYLDGILTQVSTSSAFDYTGENSHQTSNKGVYTSEMDISEKSGLNYIKIFLYTAVGDGYSYSSYDADIRIKKIWLEE